MSTQPRNIAFDLVVAIALGILVSIILIFFGSISTKWLFFVFAALCGVAFSLILPPEDRYRMLVFVFFFSIPIGIDFNPIYMEARSYRPINGVEIALYDIPFFFLFIFWLFRLVMDPLEKINFYPLITIPFLGIWCLSTIGVFMTANPSVIKYATVYQILKSWLIFLFFANNLKDLNAILLAVTAILATILFETPVGLLQWVGGGLSGLGALFGEAEHSFVRGVIGSSFAISRVGGTVGSPNNLAAYLAMLLPISVALLYSEAFDFRYRLFLTLVTFSGSVLILLTYSRGGWVGLAAGGATTIYWCTLKKTQRKSGTVVLLTWAFLAVFLLSVVFIKPVRNRLFEHDYGAAYTRIPMSILAMNMISHNPWLGVGFGNYTFVSKYYDTTKERISIVFNWPVHNEFLLVASETGLPSLLLYLFIIGVVIANLISIGLSRADPTIPYLAIGLVGTYVAWAIHHQFELMHSFIKPEIWAFFGLALAMKEYIGKLKPET